MKKVGLIIGGLLVVIIMVLIGGLIYYKNQIGPVSNSSEQVTFEVKDGDTYYSIGSRLEKQGLIKSEQVYKIYLKLNKPDENLKIGIYHLSPNMGISDILDTLSGQGISSDISITFKEGKNMRYIASVIDANTNNKESDVYTLLKDQNYLRELINEYWFIDESILNKNIYYSLEGYLFPNTYNFKDKDVSVKEIFKAMLDEMAKQIEPYKQDIINSKYSMHQILTLSSIVELEAKTEQDRALVAGVFYNRLKSKMSLGSDVTTYYASKVDMADRDLYAKEINDVNYYNTRPAAMAGKLPIGPICSPSLSSIVATLKPKTSNYYFFVADKNGKVYYTKTDAEHEQLIVKLKNEGLWYEY